MSPSPTLQTTNGAPTRRRLPVRLVPIIVTALILASAYVVSMLWLRDPGFTLLVIGAPSGSDVFIDNVRRGITASDGTIRVPGLAGGTKVVRITHEVAGVYNGSVTLNSENCKNERVCPLPVTLSGPTATQPPPPQSPMLPNVIDYSGEMLLVPAGAFTMGSEEQDDEKPPHSEPVQAFYIDKFEVTNEQYRKYCEEKKRPCPPAPGWDRSYFKERRQAPVVGVTWEDAAGYARWAKKRLPTEAEWEKAASWNASNGRKQQWPWGDVAEKERAALELPTPSDVGQHPDGASAYGVQDMAGNVNEWVDAFYQPYPGNQMTNADFGNRYRVARGCSFPCTVESAKTTRRFYYHPRLLKDNTWVVGFRCAVSVDEPQLQEYLRSHAR